MNAEPTRTRIGPLEVQMFPRLPPGIFLPIFPNGLASRPLRLGKDPLPEGAIRIGVSWTDFRNIAEIATWPGVEDRNLEIRRASAEIEPVGGPEDAQEPGSDPGG